MLVLVMTAFGDATLDGTNMGLSSFVSLIVNIRVIEPPKPNEKYYLLKNF